jgi:hypothetical protein
MGSGWIKSAFAVAGAAFLLLLLAMAAAFGLPLIMAQQTVRSAEADGRINARTWEEALPRRVAEAIIAAEFGDDHEGRGLLAPSAEAAALARVLTRRRNAMTRLLAAWMLDAKYEPNAMIDDYARLAYFGRNAFGVNDAAQSWFAKSSGELTSAEAAFLALLLASPSDPTSGEAAARRARIGREIILLRMRQRGFIDDRELEEARAARLGVTPPSQSGSGP